MVLRNRSLWAWVLCCFMLLISHNAFAQDFAEIYSDNGKPYDYKLWERYGKHQQKLNEVGFKLLNDNKYPRRMRFVLVQGTKSKQVINAGARYSDGTIIVYKGILLFFDNDDELAAVLAHEIGHIEQQRDKAFWGLWKKIKMSFAPKYYEYDADLKGIDYMVKANYNPLAMISVYNKVMDEEGTYKKGIISSIFSFLFPSNSTHPTGSKRLEKIYNYIQTNYPKYLTQENKNIYLTNFYLNHEKNEDITEIKDKYKLSPDKL